MSDAPERIWGLFDQYGHGSTMLRELSQSQSPLFHGPKPTEYIRVDLAEAIVKAALERAVSLCRALAYGCGNTEGSEEWAFGEAAHQISVLASDPAEVAAIIKAAGEKDNG